MDADPQANAWFMWAAYGVTAVILVGYGVMLWWRGSRGSGEGNPGIRGPGEPRT